MVVQKHSVRGWYNNDDTVWGDSRLTECGVSSTEERVQVKGGPRLAIDTTPNTMGLRLRG